MKPYILPIIFAFACTTLFAQTDSTKTNAGSTNPGKPIDTTAMAKVYVIRSTGHTGSMINLRLVIDNVMKCKIRNNRYSVVYVEPGTHSFNATTWDMPSAREKYAITMPVEAGKTYYMTMHIKTKFLNTEIFLEEITYNTAAKMLAKYKQDEECD